MRALCLFAVLSFAGGCAMSIEGEIEELEVIQPNIDIPGVPISTGAVQELVSLPLAQRVKARIGLPASAYEEVTIHEVRLTATSGNDLGFVRTLRAFMTGNGGLGDTEPVEIATYERTRPSVGPTLVIPRSPPADVTAPFLSPDVIMSLEGSGDLPVSNWTAEVAVKLAVKLKY